LGTSLFLLGLLASSAREMPFESIGNETVVNETARVTLGLVGHYSIPHDSYVEATYRFPVSPGDAYFLDCWAYLDLVQGRPVSPEAPVIRGMREHEFRAPVEDIINPPARLLAGEAVDSFYADPRCPGLYAVFEWPASGDWRANRPEARAQFVSSALFDSPFSAVLPALAALGAIVAFIGFTLWTKERRAREPSVVTPEETTAEALYHFAIRTEAWLVRTRRYLLMAGFLGIFLWYPLLLPWAWQVGDTVGGAPWARWAFVAGAAVLLLGLTGIWLREFRALDRELSDWRKRVARLRRREEELMAQIES